jgi:hypothetical protein
LFIKGAYMNSTLREHSIDTVHDQVVTLVAQRWAKAFVCKVTIRTDLEPSPWAGSHQPSDIIGWYVSSGGDTMEWMAEVETEHSLADLQIVDKWRRILTRGIPFYIIVPRGMRDSALKLCQEGSIPVSCIYEFTFINGVFHMF